jgi:arylsulfatase A-like enzyme
MRGRDVSWSALWSVGLAALGVVAAWRVSSPPAPETPRPSGILLVSIDTLRPDRLSTYGHERLTSPNLDRFAQDAIRFDAAFTHAPSTLPAHASLFTSLLPQHHGASFARRTPLAPGIPTLTESLSRSGYRTLALCGGGQLDPEFGLDRGFDAYDSVIGHETFDRVVARALRWLDRREDDTPFFWFLHTYEVHHPYTPSPGLVAEVAPAARRPSHLPAAISVRLLRRINSGSIDLQPGDARYIRATYDAEIRSMDRALGRLLQGLRIRGLYDDLLIVFTSDHGEEFGEHGSMGWHSHTLYDELLRVPLLIKAPGNRAGGRVVDEQVRLLDVAPTILELAGVPIPASFSGLSLAPAFAGDSLRSQPVVAWLDNDHAEITALRGPRWKLYDGRLFDLREDPAETRRLEASHPDLQAAMERRLERRIGRRAQPRNASDEVALDPDAERRLEALGYL